MLEDQPLSFRGCLFNIFIAGGPFLHPKPEDAPCCGDRDPPNMVSYSRTLHKAGNAVLEAEKLTELLCRVILI
jgi:hypothetical protein